MDLIGERLGSERPVVFARLGDDRAVNPVGAAQSAQPLGGRGLVVRIPDIVLTTQTDCAGVGKHRDIVVELRCIVRRAQRFVG